MPVADEDGISPIVPGCGGFLLGAAIGAVMTGVDLPSHRMCRCVSIQSAA